MQRLLQVLSVVEVVRAKHLAQSSIEAFHHVVSLWRLGLAPPVFDPQRLARKYLTTTIPFNLLTALHSPMLLLSLFGVRPAP